MRVFKDYTLVIVGSFFMGLGIALTKCAELGLSTISSVPNVISLKFDFLSLGTWSSIWNLVMILAQIIILGRKFSPIQFLQIPVSVIFGWFTDFGVWLFSHIHTNLYIVKLLMTIMGVAVLAFGISIMVIADKVMNPGEGIVKVIAEKLNRDFSNTKIVADILFVALAVVLSLIFFDFKIVGIREGTVIAMFGTGAFIKFFVNKLKRIG